MHSNFAVTQGIQQTLLHADPRFTATVWLPLQRPYTSAVHVQWHAYLPLQVSCRTRRVEAFYDAQQSVPVSPQAGQEHSITIDHPLNTGAAKTLRRLDT